MVTVRPAEPADLPALAGIEDAADTLFAQRFGGVDWPPPTAGEERAAEPGFLLVAVDDDGTVTASPTSSTSPGAGTSIRSRSSPPAPDAAPAPRCSPPSTRRWRDAAATRSPS